MSCVFNDCFHFISDLETVSHSICVPDQLHIRQVFTLSGYMHLPLRVDLHNHFPLFTTGTFECKLNPSQSPHINLSHDANLIIVGPY